MRFIRLFDFGDSGYFSRRTVAKPIGGGVLVAFNAYSESLVRPANQFEVLVGGGVVVVVVVVIVLVVVTLVVVVGEVVVTWRIEI